MHLISTDGAQRLKPFYQNGRPFTRVDSLPYIFRKLRLHHALSKKALAAKCHVSEDYVSRVESGSVFPSIKFCLKCAELFDANPNWVKSKWAKEVTDMFSDRLTKRLGLDP